MPVRLSDSADATGRTATFSSAGNTTLLSGFAPASIGFIGTLTDVTMVGGTGSNTLVGPDGANTWNLTAVNSGLLNSIFSYSGFANLGGGSGTDDFFFKSGASVSGNVDAGAGFDTAHYAAGVLNGSETINISAGILPKISGIAANFEAVVNTPTLQTPGVTGATTSENTQTVSGLVITPNAADTAVVTNFEITGIAGGTLFQHDGTTAIANGTFITVAQGAAGLKFTPTAGSTASGSLTVQESINATTGGLGGANASATITVTAPALNTPGVTGATTTENTQTTTGLVITPNAADTAVITNFQITGITGGTLFLNDGTTAVANGAFITVAQGAAGLKFTPTTGSTANGSLTVQESINATAGGLTGATASATITVTAPTLHTPGVTGATTTENAQTTSGLVITPNAADTAFVTNFQITGITGGTLFLNDGTTTINSNAFITVAQGAAGLKFTPFVRSTASGSLTVQESINATTGGLGGTTASATITVAAPTLHTPVVTGATTTENTQTTSGLVIIPNAADTNFVTNYQITGITGGTLFQHDGTTVIANGTFISTLQAGGLKFTPTTGSTANGSFTVQESINATTGGLGGTTATATITVTAPTLHTPGVTGATTTENTQTTSGLVITPNVADTAFVTNFQITGITGGTLFLNDGTTAIANNAFITVAQGAAGLKFTPTTGSTASGSFTVQESLNATAGGLGGHHGHGHDHRQLHRPCTRRA